MITEVGSILIVLIFLNSKVRAPNFWDDRRLSFTFRKEQKLYLRLGKTGILNKYLLKLKNQNFLGEKLKKNYKFSVLKYGSLEKEKRVSRVKFCKCLIYQKQKLIFYFL